MCGSDHPNHTGAGTPPASLSPPRRHARAFSEALAAGNLDIGRPDSMKFIFNRQIRSVTKGVFRAAVDRDNDGVVANAFYRHSRIKTYLKGGRALSAGQGCVLASPAIERVAQPTLTEDGRRAPALRFGDPGVMALASALSLSLSGACGITNKSLRALTAGSPG
jgi:hypothetical protein